MKRMFYFSFLAVMIVSLLTLSGCNTFKGIGKDIEAGGKAIQNATE